MMNGPQHLSIGELLRNSSLISAALRRKRGPPYSPCADRPSCGDLERWQSRLVATV